MEELMAYAYLYREGLMSGEEWREKLDQLFLENPEDDLLLELEWESRSVKETTARVWSYWGAHASEFSADTFGRILMSCLKKLYQQEGMDIRYFAGRMYDLWEGLPPWLQDVQPFWTLCYADDPLSWGDEAQTRELYQWALEYYEQERPETEGSP